MCVLHIIPKRKFRPDIPPSRALSSSVFRLPLSIFQAFSSQSFLLSLSISLYISRFLSLYIYMLPYMPTPSYSGPPFCTFLVLCVSTLENTTNINQPRTEAIVTTTQTNKTKQKNILRKLNQPRGSLRLSLSLSLFLPPPHSLSFSCQSPGFLSPSLFPSLSLSV